MNKVHQLIVSGKISLGVWVLFALFIRVWLQTQAVNTFAFIPVVSLSLLKFLQESES